ncbi:Ger(x)C family spore germination protein [Paenibacillus jiagnxiensis]|uniref:Ger(x)C family spore germination protein n=1 Tax=Paenibacillus jiagnxiensis TaxID=3228926 RepID=UPI0033B8319D
MYRMGMSGIALLMAVILTGCWNRTELNELAITTATGLDRSKDDWIVSYQSIVPSTVASSTGGSSGGGSQPAVHTFSLRTKTIHQAMNDSSMESPRRVYVAHNHVLIISQKAAEQGLSELLDYYLRSPETRETVGVVITEGQASDMLKNMIPPEKIPGMSLSNILDRETENVSVYPSVSVFEFAQHFYSDAGGQIVPMIGLTGQQSTKNKDKLRSLDILKKTSAPVKITLTKAAVFNGDRLVGFLNRSESYGLSWLNRKVRGTELPLPCSTSESSGRLGSVRINKVKTHFNPVKTGYHYTMQVQVKVRGVLYESACQQDLSKPEAIRGLEAILEKQIEKDIHTGWDKIQKLGIDALGFADKVHRKYPGQWKSIREEWPREFKKMDLDVQVKATIRRTGLLKKTLK